MTKSIVRSALIAALAVSVFSVAPCVHAQTNAPDTKTTAKSKEHSGAIVSIDTAANTITIKHEPKNLTFTLTPGIKVSGENRKSLTLADLKAGEHVRIRYTGEGSNLVATHIGRLAGEGTEAKDSAAKTVPPATTPATTPAATAAAATASASTAAASETSKATSAQTSAASKLPAGTKVNINTATVAELDKLPGIGPVKAQAIVDYRTANGSFKSPEDIENVKGIKEGTFSKIKDFIVVQ